MKAFFVYSILFLFVFATAYVVYDNSQTSSYEFQHPDYRPAVLFNVVPEFQDAPRLIDTGLGYTRNGITFEVYRTPLYQPYAVEVNE